jgi:hypothetical protein
MVCERGDSGRDEGVGELLGVRAAAGIDDPRLVVAPRAQPADQRVDGSRRVEDAIGEVGAVERGDVDRRPAQAELRDDVVANASGRGRGERAERDLGESLAQ